MGACLGSERRGLLGITRAAKQAKRHQPMRLPLGLGNAMRLEAGCDLLDLGQRNVWRLEQGAPASGARAGRTRLVVRSATLM